MQVLNELSRQPARQWHEPATGLVPQALQEPAGRWWLQWATGAFGTVGRTRAGQWMVKCLQPQQQALVHLEEETASSWRVRAQGREAAQWWQQLEAAACWWQVGPTRLPLVVRPVEASRSCEAQASGIS